jgi:acetate kinase
MNILVFNCGSSSVKYQVLLIENGTDRVLARGAIDRIPQNGHEQAVAGLFNQIGDLAERINGVGHRVVHGGERYRESVVFDDDVLGYLESISYLAPLHNPPNLAGYRASRKILSNVPHVAVFDTAFHHDMPRHAYLYGIPYELYEQRRLRRYGFHGTSHRYVTGRLRQLVPDANKIITCHLGNGCSIAAVHGEGSVDTSMGLTPLEGLLMGTRSGDIDPGLVLFLLAETPAAEIDELLNRKSGLLGISGVSNDMRDLEKQAAAGNERAALAIEIFCYRIRKYIGAYIAAMNGADAVVFTGGIGENARAIRRNICTSIDALGIVIDEEANRTAAGEARISAEGSRIAVWVIPTNEELLIARDTARCISA